MAQLTRLCPTQRLMVTGQSAVGCARLSLWLASRRGKGANTLNLGTCGHRGDPDIAGSGSQVTRIPKQNTGLLEKP